MYTKEREKKEIGKISMDDGYSRLLILAGVLLGSSEKFMKRLGIFKKGVIINVLALTMYYGMEIWLIPVTTMLNVNNPFSAEMLIRMLGFATGLFIAVVGSWLIYHAAKSLNDLYSRFDSSSSPMARMTKNSIKPMII